MQQLTESTGDRALVFEFPEDWQAIKYDCTQFYRDTVSKCQGTKAIDFLVLANQRQMWFEIKNFRGDAEHNRLRLDANESNVTGLSETRRYVNSNNYNLSVTRKKLFIADEVAQKIRDTAAGMFGATLKNTIELESYANALQEKQPIHIILFLQQDEELDQLPDFRIMAQRIADKIKQQLLFIDATVEVVNQHTLSEQAEWRVIRSNP